MSQPSGPSSEHERWQYEQNRAMAERAHDRQDDFFYRMNETAINASHVALRTLLLMNGGAVIALLSFDGRLPSSQAKAVAATLLWFALGVVMTAIAMALAYFAHLAMAGVLAYTAKSYQPPFLASTPTSSLWGRRKTVCHILAASSAFVSLILFVVGMLAVRAALLT
jgi:hypothetical protein